MKTIIKGINNVSLKNYPKLILKFNSMLSAIGISKVEAFKTYEIDKLYEKDLTLLILPAIRDVSYERLGDTDKYKTLRDVLATLGYNYELDKIYRFDEIADLRKEIKAKIKIGEVIDKECIIGYYYPTRNLIVSLIPILSNIDFKKNEETSIYLISKLIEGIKSVEVKKVNIVDEIERLRIENFLKQAKDTLTQLNNNINSNLRSIEDYNKNCIDLYSKVQLDKKNIISTEQFIKDGATSIRKKLEELKSVEFIKSIDLIPNGISIYIGEINLNYRSEVIPLGRFVVNIYPKEIKIFNLDALVYGGEASEYYDSPHVRNSIPCYGNWNVKVNELLRTYEFKKLILLIKLFLQSFNPESPYLSLGTWKELRAKQPIRSKDKLPKSGLERSYTKKLREIDFGIKPKDVPGVIPPRFIVEDDSDEGEEDNQDE